MSKIERETQTLVTKNGYEVTHKTYITGREMRQIQNVFLENAEVSVKGKETSISSVQAKLSNDAQDKTFETLIVSVKSPDDDEPRTDVVEAIGELPLEDYDQVVSALNEITNIKKDESGTSTP